MEKYQIYNLVYSSSATVYGAPPVIPIPETSPLQAESCYGRTKVMTEQILKDLCDSAEQWRVIALRYFNPAGAHESGEIGEDPRGKPGNLVPLLAQMAVGKFAKDGLKVFGNDYPTPDGTCVRDYIHGKFSLFTFPPCLSTIQFVLTLRFCRRLSSYGSRSRSRRCSRSSSQGQHL